MERDIKKINESIELLKKCGCEDIKEIDYKTTTKLESYAHGTQYKITINKIKGSKKWEVNH